MQINTENSLMRASSRRLHTIDGMRGIAALLVVGYHWELHPGGLIFPGYLAVDMFFVLSGIVIARIYFRRLEKGLGAAHFLELRLVRLFPLHVLGTAIGSAKQLLGLATHDPRAMHLGALTAAVGFNMLMLPDFASPVLFPLNGPSWSLFFEVIVNTSFAAFWWKFSNRSIILIMAMCLFWLLWRISWPEYFNAGWSWSSFDVGIARTFYSFMAGVIIFRFIPASIPKQSLFSIVPMAIMTLFIVSPVSESGRAASELLIVSLGFPILASVAVCLEVPAATIPVCGFLGDLSYPIYAIHWPLIALAHPLAGRFHIPAFLLFVGFMIVLLPTAFFAAKIDQIVRLKLSKWIKERRSAPPQVI